MKIIVKKLKSSDCYKGFGFWHQFADYHLENDLSMSVKISDSCGGCGVQQLYDWTNIKNKENVSEFLKNVLIEATAKHLSTSNDVGCIICQVGCSYYNTNFVKALEENGFKIISEFNNHRHGNGKTQRIYQWINEKN
jgi:hypothetical protein